MFPWRCKTCESVQYNESPINPPNVCGVNGCTCKRFERLAKICLLVPREQFPKNPVVHHSTDHAFSTVDPSKEGTPYVLACGGSSINNRNVSTIRACCTCKQCLDATQPTKTAPPPEIPGATNQTTPQDEAEFPDNVEVTIEPPNPFSEGE